MKTIEDIFNIIKKTINLKDDFIEYEIRLSNGTFERDHLINIYNIRKGIAIRQENHKRTEQIQHLLNGLENYSEKFLKVADISNNNYFAMFYLSQDWNRVIGYLENDINDDTGI